MNVPRINLPRVLAIAISIAISIAIALLPKIATACPTCKNALHQGAATGYAISIIFMMCMPLFIAAFWAVLIWRLRSKMKTENVRLTRFD